MPTPPTVTQAAARHSQETAAALWPLGSLRATVIIEVISLLQIFTRGYGATAARLTPEQKVGSSNLSALKQFSTAASGLVHTTLPGGVTANLWHTGSASDSRSKVGGSNPLAPKLSAVGKHLR